MAGNSHIRDFALLVVTLMSVAVFGAWPFALDASERARYTPIVIYLAFATLSAWGVLVVVMGRDVLLKAIAVRADIKINQLRHDDARAQEQHELRLAGIATAQAQRMVDAIAALKPAAPAAPLFNAGNGTAQMIKADPERVVTYLLKIRDAKEKGSTETSEEMRERLRAEGMTIHHDDWSVAWQFESGSKPAPALGRGARVSPQPPSGRTDGRAAGGNSNGKA